jgi:hypothetical protein
MNILFKLIITHFLFTSCALKDIRSKSFREGGIKDELHKEGVDILKRTISIYDKNKKWNQYGSAEIIYTDHWDSFFPKLFNSPYPDDIQVKYDFSLRTFNSKVEFLEGKNKGEIWGIQNWATYFKRPGKKISSENISKLNFTLLQDSSFLSCLSTY